ncbi:uncharacterized protein F5Z01DRAFT_632519 [Emericellopsis atlantica]|uniref:Uncharacterized protein n=1 Tax=Emericellopsis atlantica TaxID=2614577 RepID=A0A9P7ZV85_9HYPO|nr:uncharacterized protein F5Z01DRAFT_632519 [Emericellopsis atlantica]KAG9258441.1 hypothetical protein F5Z01DRAFT_632519 [Emericellopsis atlantica]
MSYSVAGKTAIVTGAGSGINLSFATLLLSKGCNVVFADLSLRPEAQAVVDKYSSSSSPRAVFVQTDVTSWPDLERMFQAALVEFGDYDIVCPGAGVYEPHWSNFWIPPGAAASRDHPASGRYALLDINLSHPIRTSQIAISNWLYPRRLEATKLATPEKASPQNPKKIIHIASVASQIPVFRAPLYGASKFAIAGFVRSIAPIETYGITVNAVAPGVVKTPLWTDNREKLANVDVAKDAWVTPEEVAEAMLRCVESEAGGVVLEVGAQRTRRVDVFNDPGPDMSPEAGMYTSNGAVGDAEVHSFLGDKTVWGWRSKL